MAPDEKDSLFMIRPRYKLRHEGEKVHFGDKVVFIAGAQNERGEGFEFAVESCPGSEYV